jgi:TonB-dependent SusC/RagA subfamily outer membrane receptor
LKIKNLLFLLLPAIFLAQEVKVFLIEGVVRDKRTNEVLSNANVFVPATRIGTVSNAKGRFTLTIKASGDIEDIDIPVMAKKSGYKRFSATLNTGKKTKIVIGIPLEEDLFYDDEEIASNFSPSHITRQLLGYSLEFFPNKEIEASHSSKISNFLASMSPGSYSLENSGYSTSAFKMFFRGSSSFIAKTSPTIYVDGIRFDDSNVSGGFDLGGNFISRLNDLDISNIDRIEILKGPSSAAIYGSEGGNGIIEIFTKSGLASQRLFKLSTQFDFRKLDQNLFPSNATKQILKNQLQDNHFGHVLLRKSNLTLTGGEQDHQYYISLNEINDEGIFDKEDISKQQIQTNFNFITGKNSSIKINSIFARGLFKRIFTDNSSYGHFSETMTITGGDIGNLIQDVEANDIEQEYTKYSTSVQLNYNISKYQKLTSNFGFDILGQNDALRFAPKTQQADEKFRSSSRRKTSSSARINYEQINEFSDDLTISFLLGTNYNSAEIKQEETSSQDKFKDLYLLANSTHSIPLANNLQEFSLFGSYVKTTVNYKKYTNFEAVYRFENTKINKNSFNNSFFQASASNSHKFNKRDYFKYFVSSGVAGRLPLLHESINYSKYEINDLEKVLELETGFEINLLNSRVKSRLSYFYKKYYDMYVLPPNSTIIKNTGEIITQGVEFSLSGFTYRANNFSHYLNFGITSLTDEIQTTYNSGTDIIGGPFAFLNGGSFIHRKGAASSELYLPKLDENGNANIGTLSGRITPDLFGSFTNKFTYQKFSLEVISDFAYGHKKINLSKTYRDNIAGNRDYPYLNTDVENAGYFAFREIILNYNFQLETEIISNLEASLAILNPFTVSSYSGYDPLNSSYIGGFGQGSGVDLFQLPRSRVYSIKFNISF